MYVGVRARTHERMCVGGGGDGGGVRITPKKTTPREDASKPCWRREGVLAVG